MAHRSRLCAVLVDCPDASFDASLRFWSGALGRVVAPSKEPTPRYRELERGRGELLDVILQRVDAGERGLHLDIETDDVEAEVKRLERLGARRKRQVKGWWVMEEPSGLAFCVVPVQNDAWPRGAVEWSDPGNPDSD